jgi:glycosyltransferase involved in cell wall biosynthesis
MVGTIEPRKRHEDALAAMERLWSEGQDVSLCIIGKYGWKSSHIADRLQTHPEKGRRLFWIGDASDAELQFAYRAASALIFPTWAEGYGLPIIEAAYFGLPVLCSDLPVLREVGGEHAIYFQRGEPAAIASAIRMFLNGKVQVDPAGIKRLSWAESAHQLLELVQNQTWYTTLSGPVSASVAHSS